MPADYAALASKYSNFTTPVMKVLINGSDVIANQKLAVENLSVSLSLNQAGSVHFNVVNAFELSSRTFTDAVKQSFQPGSSIKVELGYGSATSLLFQGYIAELCLDFGETPQISVTALDVIRLLMDTVHQNLVYEVTSYSAAFQAVMKEFEGMYDALEVEATEDSLTKVVQKDSSFRFIQEELCVKANREFFVAGGKAYFRTPRKETEAVAALNWGEGLMSFQERRSQCNQTIRVYGKAENKKDQLKVEVKVKTDDASSKICVVKEYQKYSLIGQDAIQKYAEQIAGRQKAAGKGGSGTCIGIPELIPGSYIKLGNLDSGEGKEYYLKSVKHNIGSSGYTTQFDVEGCK